MCVSGRVVPCAICSALTVLSYNGKPTHHESLITRGLFVLDMSADGSSATLRSHDIAWTEGEPLEPRIESMGVFADAASSSSSSSSSSSA